VQLQPKNVNAWINLAVAQFARRRYHDGIDACRKALTIAPCNLLAIFNIALAHEHLGAYSDALDWVRKGLDFDPKDASLAKLETRLKILQLRSRLVGAIKWLVGRR